ncbi:small metal-binding protein SmbP [Methylomagnum ishizawai]|uniref:small metal-binding protein SmbP n=1 Tax=Methylomagnum ishizawai TaxID=1760988 RepID=UPI001C31FB88|nr:small metal-binding protein SmbP [Methylomagnum ishizawai]BBL77024.1 hypothetical protein MishRS11D_41220 [Methylomagnum ishizawai]
MRGINLLSLKVGVLAALLALNPAFAAENHKAEALKHAEAAVASSKTGDAKAVGEHAAMAKVHTEAAEKEHPNAHFEAALKSLDGAIEHSKMGHADIAGKSAEEAVTHLNAAP